MNYKIEKEIIMKKKMMDEFNKRVIKNMNVLIIYFFFKKIFLYFFLFFNFKF